MNCCDVSAVLVTRGDQDLTPVLRSLPFDDVVVWDNSKETDHKVYGRYLAIERAKHEVIYTQDDDCIIDAKKLLEDYRDGEILCNVQPGHSEYYKPLGITLVGWGSFFHRRLADFSRYFEKFPADELFERECDRVFTGLNPFREVFIGVEHLPHAFGRDRMGTEDRHGRDLETIRKRLAAVKA